MVVIGKNVVYIGGCGGIGSATCKLLVKKKVANLAVLDVAPNPELMKELASLDPSARVFFVKIDITNKNSIVKSLNDVMSKINQIDVLVNGSGVGNEIKPEITVAVNLLGLINCSMVAMDLMRKSKNKQGGLIVNIASNTGLEPFGLAPVYGATKAAVISYTRAMAEDINFSKHGVSFICVCPGITTTNFVDQFSTDEYTLNSKEILETFNNSLNQTPEDCAKSIVEAIEICKNGATYLCELGQRNEVRFPSFWDAQK